MQILRLIVSWQFQSDLSWVLIDDEVFLRVEGVDWRRSSEANWSTYLQQTPLDLSGPGLLPDSVPDRLIGPFMVCIWRGAWELYDELFQTIFGKDRPTVGGVCFGSGFVISVLFAVFYREIDYLELFNTVEKKDKPEDICDSQL